MSPERVDKDSLSDIQEGIRRITIYIAQMTYDAFLADTRTQDAVIRNLEVIGEATKNLSTALRDKYPDVPWKGMAGIRDRLIQLLLWRQPRHHMAHCHQRIAPGCVTAKRDHRAG
jgi:uncharacterized protein with HEPN domain